MNVKRKSESKKETRESDGRSNKLPENEYSKVVTANYGSNSE